jgi:hypothetical protein
MTKDISLNGVVMVRPLIEITTGTVAINRSTELASVAGELPPTTVVSDGRKRILNTRRLAPLFNCRRAVERLLEREGAPFLGATLVPQHRLAEVEAKIAEVEAQFAQELDNLANKLDDAYQEWEDAYPAWSSLLKTNRLSPLELKQRCRFKVAFFKPAPPDEDVGERFAESMQEAVPAILSDAAGEAERLLTEFCTGRDSVTQKVVNAVRRLLSKLEGFSMLDPRVAPSVDGFRAVLEGLPRAGKLGGRDFSMLTALLRQIADPHRILEHGERLLANAKAGQTVLELEDTEAAVEASASTPVETEATAEVDAEEEDDAPLHMLMQFSASNASEEAADDEPVPVLPPPAQSSPASMWASLV